MSHIRTIAGHMRVTPDPPANPVRQVISTAIDGLLTATVRGHCPRCRDAGHVFASTQPVGPHPAAQRVYVEACPCPDCGHMRRAAASLTAAHIPGGRFLAATLETTDWTAPPIAGHLAALRTWVDGWHKGRDSLCLSGANQRGKTHLLVALGRHLALLGKVVRFARMPSLFELDRLSRTALAQFLRSPRVDLLIIDEVGGGEPGLHWRVEAYEELLGYRLERGGCCLLSTNLTHGGLVERVGERVESRMRRRCVTLELRGPEYVEGRR